MKTILHRVCRFLFLAASFAGASTLVMGSATAQSADSTLGQIIKRDKLIVATFNTAPPFGYTDEKGELVGFDIDVARLIGKSLLGDEKKVEFMPVASEGRWPAVISGRADIGLASTTVYPDRALRVAFTRPYIDSGMSIAVRRDINVNSLEELNSDKFTLANLSNPQMAERAQRLLPNLKVLTFDTPSSQFLAMKSGQAQAMQMDTPVLDWYAANNEEMMVLPEPLTVTAGNAVFMKPGDFELWLWMDTMVQEMLTGSRYNEYSEIYRKWFGRNPPPQRFYHSKATD